MEGVQKISNINIIFVENHFSEQFVMNIGVRWVGCFGTDTKHPFKTCFKEYKNEFPKLLAFALNIVLKQL